MPGWTLRELDCTHCGGTFTDMEGDLILPLPRLCDACLIALWDLSDEVLESLEINAANRGLLNSIRELQSLAEILSQRKLNRGD